MTKIDKNLLDKLAQLCSIHLEDKDKEDMLEYLKNTLSYFENIQDIPTKNVKPLISPFSPEIALRKDEAVKQTDTDVYLEQAPDKQSCFFKVPPVV